MTPPLARIGASNATRAASRCIHPDRERVFEVGVPAGQGWTGRWAGRSRESSTAFGCRLSFVAHRLRRRGGRKPYLSALVLEQRGQGRPATLGVHEARAPASRAGVASVDLDGGRAV